MSIEERVAILSKPYWSTNDIAKYFDIGIQKARKIKNEVLLNIDHCVCPFSQNKVKVDAILSYLGCTNRLDELKAIQGAK